MAFSPVSTGIFAFRSADKASKGDDGRAVVAGCQGASVVGDVFGRIKGYDTAFCNGARSAASVFSNLAKSNKAFEYAGKAVKFGVNNVNPIICASSAYKVLKSDDKLDAGVRETSALVTMFAAEDLVKKNYEIVAESKQMKNLSKLVKESDNLKPIVECISKNKLGGKIGFAVKGVALVGASIAGYNIGENIGKDVSGAVKSTFGIKA
ncbi:MAG: hypothetical protein R3Y28_00945 [Candidatus Gastranaerophilales bacterium]